MRYCCLVYRSGFHLRSRLRLQNTMSAAEPGFSSAIRVESSQICLTDLFCVRRGQTVRIQTAARVRAVKSQVRYGLFDCAVKTFDFCRFGIRDVIDLQNDDDEDDEDDAGISTIRISNSPIRSFTPISEASDCLIDFRKRQRSKKLSQRRRWGWRGGGPDWTSWKPEP